MDWAQKLENELSEQYDIPANAIGSEFKYVEIELPGNRHVLNINTSGYYGYVVSFIIYDETGGVLHDSTYYTSSKEDDVVDAVSNMYNSY